MRFVHQSLEAIEVVHNDALLEMGEFAGVLYSTALVQSSGCRGLIWAVPASRKLASYRPALSSTNWRNSTPHVPIGQDPQSGDWDG
jgi:hypothetical protein